MFYRVKITKLPVLVKGDLHPEDAKHLIKLGADGIIVSNHGGRHVDDGAVAALDVLPSIVEAADGGVPVLFDSGIRHGADVLKAIALGAKMVFIGRPFVYGLAVNGEISTLYNEGHGELELTAQCQFSMSGKTVASVSIDYLRPNEAPSHGDDRIRIAGTAGR